MKTILSWFTLGLAVAAGACSRQPEQTATAPGAIKPAAAHGSASNPAPGAGELKFTAPEGWVAETPRSAMRKAQYRLPRAEGDPEDAEMVVFYFQGSGGGVQANIDRWIDQFTTPDGRLLGKDAARTAKRQINGIPVSTVDVSGIYMASSGPMLQETQKKPNFRLLGAVAESNSGPWFFKLTGPAKTVARWENSFQKFLESMKQ